jgi:hypothetical protein
MVARAVEAADRRLHHLRQAGRQDGALAAAAFGLAVVASTFHSSFTLPLFAGGWIFAWRTVRHAWRRWDLLDRLLVEPDAYVIPDVRRRAERQAGMANRRSLSRSIRFQLELGTNPRVVSAAGELAGLADELDDAQLELAPACACACRRLLNDDLASPLINSGLPADDVRSQLRQIRGGFHRRQQDSLLNDLTGPGRPPARRPG